LAIYGGAILRRFGDSLLVCILETLDERVLRKCIQGLLRYSLNPILNSFQTSGKNNITDGGSIFFENMKLDLNQIATIKNKL
jgi:hypothetical protein